ncbi:MAG: glycerophosphodiester phosphodiesterase [Candidatus Saccharimonadales bacterium]
MLIIGHRGISDEAPENTIDSLIAAYEAGVDMLEFDVRLTKDNIPVVIHDTTTARTHGTRIVIARVTLAELRAAKLSPAIPTLEEVLDTFFGNILLNIELKSRGSGLAVIALLKQHYITQNDDWRNVIVSSFKSRELIRARHHSKRVPLAMLHGQNPFLFIAYERWLHFSAVGFHRHYINPLALQIAQRLHMFCYTYTVDRTTNISQFVHADIDGVVTNKPRDIMTALSRRNEQST